MTDRYDSLTVVLEDDIREDDSEALMEAIGQLRGVLTVSGNVTDPRAFIAESRAREQIRRRLFAALENPLDPSTPP